MKAEYPLIVGIDGTKEALNELRAGNPAGPVLNDEYGQTNGIIDLAFSLAMDTKLPEDVSLVDRKYIRIPYQKVDLVNVNDIIEMVNQNRNEYPIQWV